MLGAILVYKKKKTKMISIISALLINGLFLGAAFTVAYQLDIESWNSGGGDWRIAYLIIAIPLLTWLNAFLLQFVKLDDALN